MVECFCIHLIHIFSATQYDVLVNIYLAKEGLDFERAAAQLIRRKKAASSPR